MTVENRIKTNKADANIKMGGTAFTSAMRAPFDPSSQLDVGDVLHFPKTIDAEHFGTQSFRGKNYEFLVISVTKANGTETAINWFPTTFTKNVFEYKLNANGYAEFTGTVYPANGTAVDAFLAERGNSDFNSEDKIVKSDTQKGVEHLLGKDVKITKRELKKTCGFTKEGIQDITKLIDGAVLTYDFAA